MSSCSYVACTVFTHGSFISRFVYFLSPPHKALIVSSYSLYFDEIVSKIDIYTSAALDRHSIRLGRECQLDPICAPPGNLSIWTEKNFLLSKGVGLVYWLNWFSVDNVGSLLAAIGIWITTVQNYEALISHDTRISWPAYL